MPLGRDVGLGPGHIALDRNTALQKGHSPKFRPMPVVAKRLDGSRCHLLQSPAIAIAIARDCYILVVLFIYFFRPPNFRRPWADFRETLPHDAVCAEIVYLL